MKAILLRIIKSKVFITFAAITLLVVAGLGGYVYQVTRDLPDIGDVKSVIRNQTTYIYAKDGTLITRAYNENRTIVPIKDVSETLQNAIVSVEDQRFYKHHGIDYIRIIGAFTRNVRSGSSQGGSTITQQYVKNAYFSPEKTLERKIKEAFLAIKLERNYDKKQILEMYLNTIYFGNRAHGIEAASQTYFGIPASKLNSEQSALLAALIRAPAYYDPYNYPDRALERRNLVLDLMVDQGFINGKEAEEAKKRQLSVIPKGQQRYKGIAPYYAEWIKKELKDKNKIGFTDKEINSQGLRIYTTLDPKIQESAELSWKKYLPDPKDPDVAIVAVDPKTGAVKAMVGGKDFDKNKFNIAADQPGRQPGSAFKPFTLAAALMNGVSIDDGFDGTSPQTFTYDGGKSWRVSNSGSSAAVLDLRRATAFSTNVVFAALILKVGPEKVEEACGLLGIPTDKIDPNPALALGGLHKGVTPLEMAGAYATFANMGVYNEPYGVEKVTLSDGKVLYEHKSSPKEVIDKAVAYLVNKALMGVIQFGTGTKARIGRIAAGKTGTTQKYVDAWFCGHTPDLAAAVWVGYRIEPGEKEPKPMKNVHGIRVTGGSYPARIWSAFMKRALQDVKASNFEDAPRGSLTYVTLCDESNMIPNEFCTDVSKHVFVKKYKPKKFKTCDVHKAIPVPNLVGLSKDDAIKSLESLKLKYRITEQPSEGPSGLVIGQNPAEGTGVKEETEIELIISIPGVSQQPNGSDEEQPGDSNKPPGESEKVKVPDVVGLPAGQAANIIKNAGLVPFEKQVSDNSKPVQVINQNPQAGEKVPVGSIVTITVNR